MAGNKESNPGVQDTERELTCVMLRTVVTLLKGSVRNAGKDGYQIHLVTGWENINYFLVIYVIVQRLYPRNNQHYRCGSCPFTG